MMTEAVRSVRSPRMGRSRCLSRLWSASIRLFVTFDVVPGRWHQVVEDPWVDGCGVGDDLGRRDLQRGQRPLEEAAGGLAVAPLRDQDVDDLPMLVDRPIHVAPHAIDFDVRFVDEPPVAWRVAAESGRLG